MNPATELRNSILITLLAGGAGSYYFYSANRSRYFERLVAAGVKPEELRFDHT